MIRKTLIMSCLLGAFLLFLTTASYGQNYNTPGNEVEAEWTAAESWVSIPPPVTANNNSEDFNITINATDKITRTGDLGMYENKVTLTIKTGGYLKITGNFDVRNHLILNVESGGVLIIGGTIHLHNQGSIELNGEMQVSGIQGHNENGNDLTGEGTLYLPPGTIITGINIEDFNGTTINGSLPVEMLSFEAISRPKSNTLFWITASETNNMGFEIQRMHENHQQWEVIGWMDGHYNHNDILHYEYQDVAPNKGINYYRLRQVDYDGADGYHGPVAVLFDPDTNPKDFTAHRDAASLHIALEGYEPCLVEVYDLSGRQLVSRQAVYKASVTAPQKPVIVRVTYSSGHVASRIVR